jgi:hypothetical protein
MRGCIHEGFQALLQAERSIGLKRRMRVEVMQLAQ